MNPVAVILRAVQIVRGWGVTVTFEPGWETRGNGYSSNWVGVLPHHTGTPSSLDNPFPTRRLLRDGRTGLAGPLCNSAGPADGSIHVMAAQAANHAGASGGRSMGPLPTTNLFNPRVFGHEIDYAGTVPMLPGQYRSAVLWSLALLIALREAGQIPTVDPQRTRAHAETSITGKWDPGEGNGRTIDMNAFRAAVAAGPVEDDMTPDQDRMLRAIYEGIYAGGPSTPGKQPLATLIGDTKTKVQALYDGVYTGGPSTPGGRPLATLIGEAAAAGSAAGAPTDEQIDRIAERLRAELGSTLATELGRRLSQEGTSQ